MRRPDTSGYGASEAENALNREEFLVKGMELVRRMAFRMARRLPSNVQVDDLIGAGMEGLVKAMDAYDPARQPQFESYAKSRIRGAILDELRSGDSLTRYGRTRMGEITSAIKRLQQLLGRHPTEEEVAKEIGVELAQYQRMAGDLGRAPALAGLGALGAEEVASNENDPAVLYDEAEGRAVLVEAIGALPQRAQQVLALYYQEECTQAEIGEILGVTESRVCQLLGEATARLRVKLAASGAGFEPKAASTSRSGRG